MVGAEAEPAGRLGHQPRQRGDRRDHRHRRRRRTPGVRRARSSRASTATATPVRAARRSTSRSRHARRFDRLRPRRQRRRHSSGRVSTADLLIFKSDFSDASVAESIVQAVDEGADSINMSFGTDGSAPAAEAVDEGDRLRLRPWRDHDRCRRRRARARSRATRRTCCSRPAPAATSRRARACRSPPRTSPTAGRPSPASAHRSRSPPTAPTEQGGPRGIFGAFPGNTTVARRSPRLGSPALQLPDELRRRQPLRLSAGDLDVRPDGRRGRRSGPRPEPGPQAHPTSLQILKQTARRTAPGWTPDLGWGILDGGAALAAARDKDKRAPKSRDQQGAHACPTAMVKLTHHELRQGAGRRPVLEGLDRSGSGGRPTAARRSS